MKTQTDSVEPPLDTVVRFATWPRWRRLLSRPDKVSRRRMEAWNDFTARLVQNEAGQGPQLLVPLDRRSPGIFGLSIAHWDFLAIHSGAPTVFDGFEEHRGSIVPASLKSIHGALVAARHVDEFDCDICEVDGIAASKSSDNFFESVDAFGADFVAFRRMPVDVDGLRRMLAHPEVRITRCGGGDTFAIRCWDGRLFLQNAGGSHHFAGAAHISRSIGQPVPLRGKLQIHSLNCAAFSWLFDEYIPMAGPRRLGFGISRTLARVVSRCFVLKLPALTPLGALGVLLLPRNSQATSSAEEALRRAGFVNVQESFEQLIDRQRLLVSGLRDRFSGRIEFPDNIDPNCCRRRRDAGDLLRHDLPYDRPGHHRRSDKVRSAHRRDGVSEALELLCQVDR